MQICEGSSPCVLCVGNLASANLCKVFVWGVFCGVAAKLCRVLVWEFTGRGIIFDPGLLCKKIKLRRLLNQQNFFDFLVLFLLPFFCVVHWFLSFESSSLLL